MSVAAERYYGGLGISAQEAGLNRELIIARSVVGGLVLLSLFGLGGATAVWIGTIIATFMRAHGLTVLAVLVSAGFGLIPLLVLIGIKPTGLPAVVLVLVAALGGLLLLAWLAQGDTKWTRWRRVGPLDPARQLLVITVAVFTFIGLAAAADNAVDHVRNGEVPAARILGFVAYPWSATVAYGPEALPPQRKCRLYLGGSPSGIFLYEPLPEQEGRTLRLPVTSKIELRPGQSRC